MAEPWRRLLAASLDTLLLFSLLTIVLLLSVANNTPFDKVAQICAWILPVICWGYAWFGWSVGKTLGMHACSIKIIRINGERMNSTRALLRLVGYMLACLPVKGGLVPILTHPLRQGWHDRIAGTVVVKTGTAADFSQLQLSDPSFEQDGSVIPSPDFSILRKGWIWPLLAYLCLALLFTYPVAAHFSTRLAGIDGDSKIFVWDYAFVNHALRTHSALSHTRLLFYPSTSLLYFDTMDWFNGIIATPLIPTIGLVATYNTLFIGSLTLSAFTSYLLLAALTRDRLAAAIAAPIFGLSPFFLVHGLGHANLYSAEFLPLFALFLCGALSSERPWFAVAAGVAFALAALCDLQYILFCTTLTILLMIGIWWRPRSLSPEIKIRHFKALAITFVVGGLLIAPLVVPTIVSGSHKTYMNKSGESGGFKASVSDFISPEPIQSLVRAKTHDSRQGQDWRVEWSLTPGIAAWLLILYSLSRRAKPQFPWYVAALGAAIIALGPFLTIGSYLLSLPSILSQIVLGFPGNGFSLPWEFDGFIYFSQSVLSNTASALSGSMPVMLPEAWLPAVFPLLKPFRVPARLGEVLLLALAVVAAYGLSHLLRRLRMRFSNPTAVAVSAAIALLICAEYSAIPYPTYKPLYSKFFTQLAQEPGENPVIDMPLGPDLEYQYDQAIHQKPMFAGFLSRTPIESYSEIQHNVFLQSHLVGSLPVDIKATPATTSELRDGLNQLQDLGAKYVILHKTKMIPVQQIALNDLLVRQFGLTVVWDDPIVRVYQLPPRR